MTESALFVLTLFESRSLTTFAFLNDLYFSKASVRTFSVQSFETSDTNSRNHLGSHSVRVGLEGIEEEEGSDCVQTPVVRTKRAGSQKDRITSRGDEGHR